MNYAIALKKLISIYPVKDRALHPEIHWLLAEREVEQIIANIDTEILTELTLAFAEKFGEDYTYLLVVGTKFGSMPVPEGDDTSKYSPSYYLKTGVMYGDMKKKNPQFQFEVTAIADRNGIRIVSNPEKIKSSGNQLSAFAIITKILDEFYSTRHL